MAMVVSDRRKVPVFSVEVRGAEFLASSVPDRSKAWSFKWVI